MVEKDALKEIPDSVGSTACDEGPEGESVGGDAGDATLSRAAGRGRQYGASGAPSSETEPV